MNIEINVGHKAKGVYLEGERTEWKWERRQERKVRLTWSKYMVCLNGNTFIKSITLYSEYTCIRIVAELRDS